MTNLSASIRSRNAVAVVGLFAVVIGPIPYFIAFLFAYGFSIEPISLAQHAFFLAVVTVIAVVIALVATPFVRVTAGLSTPHAVRFALLISLALNLVVLGIGSVVSALNADVGSITAEYAWPTDVLLASVLLGSAVLVGWLASRYRPR